MSSLLVYLKLLSLLFVILQARPPDYAPGYLLNEEPISFHKHWLINPVKIYEEWFMKEDTEFFNNYSKKHVEL